LPRENG
jgi:hypothetical protein